MFYKLGQQAALSDLGLEGPMEALGLKKKREGYFGVKGPGTGAIMGTAMGTSAATGLHTLGSLLGKDVAGSLGVDLPTLVALGGLLGAGAGGLYGASLREGEK